MSSAVAFSRLLYRALHDGEDTFFTLPGTSSAENYMKHYRGLRLHYATNMTVRPTDGNTKETGVSASLDVGLVLIPGGSYSTLNHALLVTTALDWRAENDDYRAGSSIMVDGYTSLVTTFAWQHPDNLGDEVSDHIRQIITLAKEVEPDMLCLLNPDRSTVMPDDAYIRLDRWTENRRPTKSR